MAQVRDANIVIFSFLHEDGGRRNSLLALRVRDLWVEDVAKVCQEIVSFFLHHLPNTTEDRSMLNNINLSDISLDDDIALSTTFLLEVDAVVADNKGIRAKTSMASIFLSLKSFGIFLGGKYGFFQINYFPTSTCHRVSRHILLPLQG